MQAEKSWAPERWDRVFAARSEWSKYPSEYVIRFVARNWYQAAARTSVRLLDLGSGPGSNTWYMSREGFSVSAVDGSQKAVALLRARLSSEHLTADLKVADYVNLPWPDNFFDGAIDHASIMHNPLEKSRRILNEVRRVLKPGGKFLSVSVTKKFWGWRKGRQIGSNGYDEIREGPLVGLGFIRFMDRADVRRLYGRFSQLTIDRASWNTGNGRHLVDWWLIECRK